MSDSLYSPEKHPDFKGEIPKKKAGRPSASQRHPRLKKKIFQMASMMMTIEEIAAHLNLNPTTVHKNFSYEIRRGKLKACGSLRAKQYQKAMQGSDSMLKWIGIQELGQKQRFDFDFESEADPWAGANFYDFAPPEQIEKSRDKITSGEVFDATYEKIEAGSEETD